MPTPALLHWRCTETSNAVAISYQLVPPGTKVYVALSGGPDSMALLHLALHRGDICLLGAVHINHNLRQTALRDQQHCQAWCRQWGVPFFAHSITVPSGPSVEQSARAARYQVLDRYAAGDTLVLTAHNLTDQAETFLFRAARGSGTGGICGIPARRGNYVRPLLGYTKDQLVDYCNQNGVGYVVDETNADTRYTRNYIRANVLPALQVVNPAAQQHIAGVMGAIAAQRQALLHFLPADCLVGDKLVLKPLAGMPQGLCQLAAEQYLHRFFDYVTAADMASMAQLMAGQIEGFTTGKLRFCRCGGAIVPDISYPPVTPKTLQKGDTLWQLGRKMVFFFKKRENIHNSDFNVCLDCDKINGMLQVRSPQRGDTIRPAGRKLTKTLKKLFQELGIPPAARLSVALLCDDNGVVAIPGYCVDERVRVTATTTHCLIGVWEDGK